MSAKFDLRIFMSVVLIGIVCTPVGAIPKSHAGKEFQRREKQKIANLIPIRFETPATWFAKFDEIQAEVELTPEEKRDGHWLMLQALWGAGKDCDQERANVLLKKMIGRYRNAAEKLCKLASVPATKPLQDGYAAYWHGVANLSADCIALRTKDAAGHFRRLSGDEIDALMKRKHLLESLLDQCIMADMLTRSTNNVPSDTRVAVPTKVAP